MDPKKKRGWGGGPSPEPPKRMRLTDQMAELVKRGKQYEGRPVRIDLPRGLRITLNFSWGGGDTWLQLSRKDTFPSTTEWTTVLQAIPGGAQQQDKALQSGYEPSTGDYWLRARIAIAPQMI